MLSLRLLLVVLMGALLSSGVACKKSGQTGGATTFTIKGADEVTTALDKKDYEGAVAALVGVKGELPDDRTSKEWEQYRTLSRKVQEVLISARDNDPAAARAYEALRITQTGR